MSEYGEPWAVCTSPPNPHWYEGLTIFRAEAGTRVGDACCISPTSKTDAMRIVACVNALAGVSDDALANDVVGTVREALEKIVAVKINGPFVSAKDGMAAHANGLLQAKDIARHALKLLGKE